MIKANIKRLDPSVELPKYHTAESAGFDISAAEDKIIQPNAIDRVRTGLIIEAPEGHFLMLAARGSLAAKKGLKLSNAIGVIDRDYAGPGDEIFLAVHNFTKEPVEIKKGERLAQGMFIRVDQVEWEEIGQMRGKDRGSYGHTGGYK